jgi:hypothetical protein
MYPQGAWPSGAPLRACQVAAAAVLSCMHASLAYSFHKKRECCQQCHKDTGKQTCILPCTLYVCRGPWWQWPQQPLPPAAAARQGPCCRPRQHRPAHTTAWRGGGPSRGLGGWGISHWRRLLCSNSNATPRARPAAAAAANTQPIQRQPHRWAPPFPQQGAQASVWCQGGLQ